MSSPVDTSPVDTSTPHACVFVPSAILFPHSYVGRGASEALNRLFWASDTSSRGTVVDCDFCYMGHDCGHMLLHVSW